MGQAIAKISRFIIHIICKDGNSKKITHCNLDNNSSCSTDVAAEANEPLITATHDDSHVISIQTTLDDYLSCSSNVVVESNESLITTTHDSYVISIQTLDDNSSCSTDVVVEVKELLIATTDHDSHVISIQTLDDNSSCSTDGVAELKELLIATTDHDSHAISIQVEDKDHDPPCADNCIHSKSSGNDNKNNAKVKEIATVTIPKQSKVKREDKWLRASPSVEKKNAGGEREKVGILPTPAASMDPTFLCLPRSNSNYWSVASGEKVGISSILPSPPTADNCNRSKSNDNDNKNNAKVKEIATVTIPKPPKVKKEDKWLRISPVVEKKNSRRKGKKVEILPTPPVINLNSTFLHLPRSNSNSWSMATGDQKVKILRISPFPPTAGNGTRHYCSNHRILLVGEGDFSFSACLAKAFGFADNMVATSLDSLDFLEKNYPFAQTNIGCLRNRGGTVLHNLDATNMEFNIFVNEYIYDRIIYNFPLAGFFNESRRQHLKRNRKLVRSFMENAKNLMASDGEIHITHKTSPMYQEWGIENLAKQCGLKLIEEVEFKLSDYPGYHNKYGFGGNGDFNCYPSKTYKFGLK